MRARHTAVVSAAVVLMLLAGGAARAADAPAAPAAVPASVYARAVDDPARSAKDRARDAREHPAEVLALAGIRPGQTVADVFGGGGYYSELVAGVVGPQGKVLLVNNPSYVEFTREDSKPRFKDGRLPTVQRSVVESCNLGLEPDSLDAAMIVMSYHDLYHYDPEGWPRIDANAFLEQIRRAVKPGGVFLIVDHSARAGTGNSAANELHRIDEQYAIKDIESHGFKLDRKWDGLRNPDDDRSKAVFDPAVRGKTDRFVHVYRRIG